MSQTQMEWENKREHDRGLERVMKWRREKEGWRKRGGW